MASRDRSSTSDKEERLNGKLHILRRNQGDWSKECSICFDRKKDQRREFGYHCATCTRKLGLHIGNCFEIYHTKENYR